MSALNIQKRSRVYMPEVKQKWNSTLHCVYDPPSSTGMFSLLFGRSWRIMSDSVHEKCVQVNWEILLKNVWMTNKERREVKAESTAGWATDEKIQQQPTTSLKLIIIFFPTAVINCTTKNVTNAPTHQRVLKKHKHLFVCVSCLVLFKKENNFPKMVVAPEPKESMGVDCREAMRIHTGADKETTRLPMDEIHSIFFRSWNVLRFISC